MASSKGYRQHEKHTHISVQIPKQTLLQTNRSSSTQYFTDWLSDFANNSNGNGNSCERTHQTISLCPVGFVSVDLTRFESTQQKGQLIYCGHTKVFMRKQLCCLQTHSRT